MRVAELLHGVLAPDEIVTAPQALRLAASDTFFEGPLPLALLAPRSAQPLAAALPRLVAAGIAVVPRGAALSYSAGLAPDGGAWVALDLRHLARVLEIRDEDALVRVEAGCSWATLDAALAARGLRTPFRGPASGRHATIGGTLSQDAVFHGSARYGTAADGVLGLAVLLADGRLLRTGVDVLRAAAAEPAAADTDATPVAFGPDLTRLFLGACGAFGVLLEATLRTTPRPIATRTAGFRCATRAGALAALRTLGRCGDASDALLLDPSVATRLSGAGADAAQDGVPGRACAPQAPWLLAVCVDAASDLEADARLARVECACLAAGASRAGPDLLAPWQAEPFPPPTMLRGADGRRWVPVHGLVPHSRAAAALDALDTVMRGETAEIEALGLRWSIACSAIGAGGVLVEANLTWPATANPVVDAYLGAPEAAPSGATTALAARIDRLRRRLALALDAAGASHLQIGRFYAYRERLGPVAGAVLDDLARLLDPHGLMNPGVLGLGRSTPRGTAT